MDNKKRLKWIKSTFLKLTSKTYPYGYEEDLVEEMINSGVFPKTLQKDSEGNYFLKIGESKTMFASHLDTACKDQVNVSHLIDGRYIRTGKTSILGADDKAGVTILLWLMRHNVPGLYYFFIGEEVGCIGSGNAAKSVELKGLYDRVISFDRRGTKSVITHQSSTRTCSNEFADSLAFQLSSGNLSYERDDTGVYTDSAEFTSVIPECTNISVGYYNEHTNDEHQDIEHLSDLAGACLLVKWEDLPTKRDMTKVESKYDDWGGGRWNHHGYSRNRTWNNSNYSQYDYGQYGSRWNDDEGYGRVNNKRNKTRRGNDKKGREDLRKFYDFGNELITEDEFLNSDRNSIEANYEFIKNSGKNVDSQVSKDKYDSLKDKFFETRLSMTEIETIKNQYLDMDDQRDKDCYEALICSLTF